MSPETTRQIARLVMNAECLMDATVEAMMDGDRWADDARKAISYLETAVKDYGMPQAQAFEVVDRFMARSMTGTHGKRSRHCPKISGPVMRTDLANRLRS